MGGARATIASVIPCSLVLLGGIGRSGRTRASNVSLACTGRLGVDRPVKRWLAPILGLLAALAGPAPRLAPGSEDAR